MVTRAAGHPNYSASGSGFIPEIWAGKGVEKFYTSTVFGEIANTDYEGEISAMGDKVYIRTTPDIAVSDYVRGGGLDYGKPSSPKVELNIDQAKSFAFQINSIDEHQTDRKLMEEWSDDAGQRMKIAVDRDVLGSIYADASDSNSGSTAGAKSGDLDFGSTGAPLALVQGGATTGEREVMDFLLDIGQGMDEQDLPDTGRWIVLPSWACRLLKGSDLRDASITGDGTSVLRNGRIGMIDRLTIYQSNNLSMVDDGGTNVTNIVAGHKAGLTFASQMTDMEDLPNPNDFGQLVRGLNVFGYKVIEPEYIFHGYAHKA